MPDVATGYVLGWGSLALINAALANIDGRGPLKYFLGSWFPRGAAGRFAHVRPPRQKALGRFALHLQRLDSTITACLERHCAYAIFWSAGVRKQLLRISIGDFRAQYSNEP